MKKLIFITLSLALLVTSCKKDEPDSNAFTYDGKSYELASGAILDYGDVYSDETGNFEVYLYSSGISIIADELSGKGDGVHFDFISPKMTELATGTYTFSTDETASTFPNADIMLNFDSSAHEGDEYETTNTSTGKATVSKSGSTYTIDFEFTVEGGKTVKGYYSGALKAITLK